MLTVKEAARKLGVHPKTVLRWIADQTLPASRVGPRVLRISAEDLSRFTKAGRTC